MTGDALSVVVRTRGSTDFFLVRRWISLQDQLDDGGDKCTHIGGLVVSGAQDFFMRNYLLHMYSYFVIYAPSLNFD